MTLLILSFFAGVLTVAAPCILPLLPVVIGGALVDDDKKKASNQWLRPVIIAASLAVSVIVFTLALKATTALLGVPESTWKILSGGIVLIFGINLVFPSLWEKLSSKLNLTAKSNRIFSASSKHSGHTKEIIIGASLGPIFSSCSPTYALIVAVVLPQSFLRGLAYLIAYALGLAVTLLLIAIAGRSAVQKLGWASNPLGWFRRTLGILFLVVGVAVVFGLDKKLQIFVLDRGWYDPVKNLEIRFKN